MSRPPVPSDPAVRCSSAARSASSRKRVALLIETSSGYGRELLSGVVRYMRMRDEWSVFLSERDLTRRPPDWLSGWKGDGIISRATTPELGERAAAAGVPLLELTDRASQPAHVRSDDEAIGRAAADHLRSCGHTRFAFCGFEGEAWSSRREAGFAGRVAEWGMPCESFHTPWHGPDAPPWEEGRDRLVEWLAEFPRPLGLMACNDARGQQVLDACSDAGLAVPEDVAVVGVDNDDLLCRLACPPLSSVIPDAAGIGYLAAELLDEWMSGGEPPTGSRLLPPLGVATRQSTDAVAIDDPGVAAALHYISQNACRGISVEDAVRSSPVSRSTLERKVRKHLGRTPQEEIRQVQVKRASELLRTTDLTVDRIATLCGFDHPEYLHVVFKRLTGYTPGQFRDLSDPAARPGNG